MQPNQYRRLRELIGTRKEVAPLLNVHPKHVAAREQGNRPITIEAGYALRWLVHTRRRPTARKSIKPINRKRIIKLRAKQYGTDGKRELIMKMRSCVSGKAGSDWNRMTPSHVLGTRATGGGPAGMVPMLASENDDWDSLDSRQWLKKYGISKAMIRTKARRLHKEMEIIL